MMDTTINELETTIGQIRDTINKGIDNRSDLTEDDKLKDDAPLVDYIEAITKLKANITETGQQIIILYTYAESKAAAEKKKTPTISWKKNENEEYVIEYGEFDQYSGVPSGARPQDPTHKLGIRFASITKDADNADFGEPIQMTGEQGPKGDQGIPGTDAVILTAVHRLVKLYCESDTKPTVPAFRKDTSSDSKFENDLDVTRIYYYGDETKPIYIAANTGVGRSKYTGDANDVVGEIDVDINSKNDVVNVISDPVRKNITVTVTEVTYATSDNEHTPPTDGWDVRDNVTLNKDFPYLGSKTTTTYSDGFSQDTYLLINEVPTTITGIEIKYFGTSDFEKPSEKAEGVDDMPLHSPVIWKKETIAYSNEIFDGENTKTTVVPIVKQGPAGVQFIGHVNSPGELPELSYTDEFVGRIAMLVGADTYIGYGVGNPELENCQQYNGQYGLNMGPIHVCDGDAKEGELGYIKNRTHYVSKTECLEKDGPIQTIYADNRESIQLIIDEPNIEITSVTILLDNEYRTFNVNIEYSIDISGTSYSMYLDKYGYISCSSGFTQHITYIKSFTAIKNEITQIPTEFVNCTQECDLQKLLLYKGTNQLQPGVQYLFTYENKTYSVLALSKSELNTQCCSEFGEMKVNGSNSVINIGELKGISENSGIKIINQDYIGNKNYCFNLSDSKGYSNPFDNSSVLPSTTNLDIYLFKDVNGNEGNPTCVDLTQSGSSGNIIRYSGSEKVSLALTNSHNNVIDISSDATISHCNNCLIYNPTSPLISRSGNIIGYTMSFLDLPKTDN